MELSEHFIISLCKQFSNVHQHAYGGSQFPSSSCRQHGCHVLNRFIMDEMITAKKSTHNEEQLKFPNLINSVQIVTA